jgi:hypothetical protein
VLVGACQSFGFFGQVAGVRASSEPRQWCRARSSGPGGMWLLSSSGAEEVSPPLTCPVAFGVSRGFGGKMGATFWKRLLSSAKSLLVRANLS